ncbi:MAG TPA: CoA transferase [Candidatus Binatia bacterium]|jgi:CoA:oxalate CoA-transferase|nr:CoA transferase [Candidatus Binatia bacterium]
MSALADVRILDLTRFLAGPFCTSLLADLGATVVKIEAPKGGDEGRYGYPPVDGVPVFFLALNRNKQGITLDLRKDEGRALLRRLLPHFDVLVENFAGGTLAKWGLAPEDLCREHPRLIVASLSGFGQTGPWSARPSYDIITQASSGFMSLTGFPGNPPTRGGGSLGDYVQGLFGAIGVLGAINARHRTGRGQAVDVSSQDAMFSLLDSWPAIFAASGRMPSQVGNRHLGTAPYDSYRAQDGWIVIAVASNKLFRALAGAIGRPELGDDPRFRGVSGRLERTDEINGIIGAWVGERTVEQVMEALGPDGAGVPCSPIYTVDQLLGHPQLLAREMIQRLPHPTLGEVIAAGVVPKLSDTPGSVRKLGPELGQHTDQVLRELLGMSDDEIARLRQAQVI